MRKLENVVNSIEKIDFSLKDRTQQRLDQLTKPQGSLGKLEDIAKKIVEITREENPPLSKKVIFTLAGDHGVVDEGVSAFPAEVTSQMVYNFLKGGAGVNVLANHVGAEVVIADMGVKCDLEPSDHLIVKKVGYGTHNIAHGPAMSREDAITTIENGIEIFDEKYTQGIDIVGTGEMGIGNTTPSSAIVSIFTGASVEKVTGKGTGISNQALEHKVKIITKSIKVNNPDKNDAIDVLSKVGGFEIGGLAGVILAAASRRIPIVIDGFISTAAALTAYHLSSKVKDYMIAAHRSVECGHTLALAHLGLDPILDLNLRLGEGTGAALAMNTIEASLKILSDMATFTGADVSQKR